ncbi:MAG: alpha/beta fold hydrolase [Pseudomonadota bacterium]
MSGLAVIASIDVVDYTPMMRRDADGTLSALNKIFSGVVRPRTAEFSGKVIKLLGDGALIRFDAARAAIDCARAIQADMRAAGASAIDGESIRLRIGVHAGDVQIRDGDVFGDAVNIAARLQAEASSGGALVSKLVADLAGADLGSRLRREGPRSLKGVDAPIETLSIRFEDAERRTTREELSRQQEVRFFTGQGGVNIAWASVGSGAPVMKAPNWIGHLELDWRNPAFAWLLTSIASRYKLVRFDARGNGLSDWDIGDLDFETLVDDLARSFDAAEVERAPILCLSQGSGVAAAFAARNPERVSGLLVMGGFAQGRAMRTSQKEREQAKALKAMMTAGWDDEPPSLRDLLAEMIIPSASLEERRIYAEDMRKVISPENMGKFRDVIDGYDVTDLLPQVTAPSLIIHSRGDRMQPIEQGRKLAAGIPNSRFLPLDSNDHVLTVNEPAWPLFEREALAFLESVTVR